MEFMKVKTDKGRTAYIRKSSVMSVVDGEGSYTKIYTIGDAIPFEVRESVEHVLEALGEG